jgi:hypothetical protein
VKKNETHPHTKPQKAQRFTKKKQAKPHPDPLQEEREKKVKFAFVHLGVLNVLL